VDPASRASGNSPVASAAVKQMQSTSKSTPGPMAARSCSGVSASVIRNRPPAGDALWLAQSDQSRRGSTHEASRQPRSWLTSVPITERPPGQRPARRMPRHARPATGSCSGNAGAFSRFFCQDGGMARKKPTVYIDEALLRAAKVAAARSGKRGWGTGGAQPRGVGQQSPGPGSDVVADWRSARDGPTVGMGAFLRRGVGPLVTRPHSAIDHPGGRA